MHIYFNFISFKLNKLSKLYLFFLKKQIFKKLIIISTNKENKEKL